MGLRAFVATHRRASLVLGLVLAALFSFALFWFAPHKAFIDQRVEQAEPQGAVVLASGAFRSLEHETSGTARVLKQPDGRRMLRLENLKTSNGPELRVLLSSMAPSTDWSVYDDGAFLDVADLAGNVGSSNYDLPNDVDLSKYATVVVWCRRFGVGFGVAPLQSAPRP
jgi:hypothetical protein